MTARVSSMVEKQETVREVMLLDGQWRKVESCQIAPAPWDSFHFTTPGGEEFRGSKSAILAVRG